MIPAGPLPWDDLSSSDDEEYSPRQLHAVHTVPEQNAHLPPTDATKTFAGAGAAAAAEGQSAGAPSGLSLADETVELNTPQEAFQQVAPTFIILTLASNCSGSPRACPRFSEHQSLSQPFKSVYLCSAEVFAVADSLYRLSCPE